VVPTGLAALLVAVTPFWMIGIERFTRAAPPLRAKHVVGLALGFTGVLFLVWPELGTGSGPRFLAGVAATQVACIGWAIGSNYARLRPREGSPLGASALQMVFGGLALLVIALVRGETITGPISVASWSAVTYLVFVGSIVGFTAYARALERLPLSFVSLYAYINPIIAVALGAVMLGERVTPRLLVASALVLAGVASVRRP
jgi:drug/metabolite transporter (DMT)-like permease